ncbi:MAG: spermidine/putrescine ABC transporter substrate-binding protein [candidate division KSB1 bacterium]|nr:spermidine/putrescine ABC transporter substrate-binding protein [candidate division KSB1 bacterium]MDZ7345405.1 spermidine/putrescine ABC transporter substrate-binding protein [candidate division KSB1 bacterium]
MKQLISLIILAALVLSCAEKKPVLHFYNWADYVDPEMIAQFEEEYDCRVIEDTFDSNESMYAKLKAGAVGYDVIVPSSYMVNIMIQQDMLMPLDHNKISNLKNVDSSYVDIMLDPAMTYSVPWAVTFTGIAYLKDKVEIKEPSWRVFERSDLAGRMTLLNDMRETIGAALKALGYSLNTTDERQLAQAKDLVLQWKKNIAKFENEQYKTGLVSEEFYLVHGYSGDILQVSQENENIVFMLPKEGGSVSMDEMVIPKSAPNPDLAHKFINFMLRPEVAAANIRFTSYLFPNKPAYELLPEELRSDPILFPPAEIVSRFEVIRDLGIENQKYTRVWDEIKAGK